MAGKEGHYVDQNILVCPGGKWFHQPSGAKIDVIVASIYLNAHLSLL